jgi:hypothetical protein
MRFLTSCLCCMLFLCGGCASQELRCDGRLQPINTAVPGTNVEGAAGAPGTAERPAGNRRAGSS